MTTSTLFSSLGYSQNQGGPPVPAATIVNAGGPITRAVFTLTVTPASGWAEAAVSWGPDGLVWHGQASVYSAPGGGSVEQPQYIHDGPASGGSVGGDDAQYFQASLINVSPGATATLTMTY
ncbi:MAG: hypothetical protein EPO08_03470 [Rhodospirillaceae bacterium]|nr:MAG: hypothetical protein EPO08_03470 [Rhodospirillaceae bacterium]